MSVDQPTAGPSSSSSHIVPGSPRTEAAQTSTATSSNQSPTIFVSYGTRSVKARVDREVPLAEIIRQLVASTQLGINESPTLFALREKDSGALVTDENLLPFLDQGLSFVLTSAPTIEAAEMVEKLESGEASVLKLATFSLRSLITERAFLDEFLVRGGFDALQDVIMRVSGNTLAYSLLSLQSMLDLEDRGWSGLRDPFCGRIVEVITTEPLINISRPATAILRKLSLTAPPLSWKDAPSPPPSPVPAQAPSPASGFPAVWAEITKREGFMKTVIGRLGSGDQPLAALSLGLINSLFKGATETGDSSFLQSLEKHDAFKTVGKLLDSQKAGGELLGPILTFQAHLVAALNLLFTTRIQEEHYPLFDEIFAAAMIADTDEQNRWRRLGFRSESPQYEFESTGLLGLKALAKFAEDSANEFATSLKDQAGRSEERRCPVATVSSCVLLALAEHFDVAQGVSPSPNVPQPFLLRFYECHALAVAFFLRIWIESAAKIDDFERVLGLTRSQITATLASSTTGNEKSWFKVRQEFLSAEYKTVRERAVREIEQDDEVTTKAPVRSLRGRLYLDSYEFVKAQRIDTLCEGAWFRSSSTTAGQSAKKAQQQPKPWRFYRLAANKKALHFVETSERIPIRGGLEDLPNKIDLALVTDIVRSGSTESTPAPRTRNQSIVSLASNSSTGKQKTMTASSGSLTFSLLSAEGVLAELVAPDEHTLAEWLDGLSLLRPEGNLQHEHTTQLIAALTEVGVKVKLLDLSGERVEIPVGGLAAPLPPSSTDFFFANEF